jgi:arylsulfatase A-like enzyme
MSEFNRRSFLKMVGAAAPAIFLPGVASWAEKNLMQPDASKPNVIILLFDAMSATNLSLYGYHRPTTPNLERFAEHATVYHSHSSGGNFTMPGVATLLTGTYPWTNRAINHSGVVKRSMATENIFTAFGQDYHRLAFPQSVWSNFIVTQFANDVDTLMPSNSFGALDYLVNDQFPKDQNMALRALDDFAFKSEMQPTSLVFGTLENALYFRNAARLSTDGYPRGLPHNANYPLYFRLDDVFDGLGSMLPGLQSPHFSYIHLFPPHAPYRATSRFDSKFIDGWWPNVKPTHRFSEGSSNRKLTSARRSYDEYIASIDWELGNLFDVLEREGVFENSYVIVTADHGEMFERGEKAHSTVLLYDPVIHIPLLISAPGQKKRNDIYAPTNAVDVLPTLMNVTGKPVPSWTEGKILPGLGGVEDYDRATFSIEAKTNSSFAPLTRATFAMRKGTHKLIYYTGYEPEDSFELYDLETDVEEIHDLYPARPEIAGKLKQELLDSLSDVNKPYQR